MTSRVRRLAVMLGLFIGYVVLDRVSFMHEYSPVGITPWNPSPGLALAALVIYGLRLLPVVAAAALFADIVVRDMPVPLLPMITTTLVITVCYGAAAAVLRRRLTPGEGLWRQRDVFALMAVGALTSLVVAGLCVGIFVLTGELPRSVYSAAMARYWIGDMIGVAVVTPLLLVHRRLSVPDGRAAVEVVLQVAALAAVLIMAFGTGPGETYSLFYLLFLPLIWIAARFGIEGATLGTLGTQAGLVAAFVTVVDDSAAVTGFQFRMLVMAISTLFLGAAVSQRRRVEEILRRRRDEVAQYGRLSLAGEMAAALAHELNQPLLAIIAFTRAAQRLSAKPERAAEAMDKAVRQAERAGDILRTLREFIGTGGPRTAPHRVAALVKDALAVVAADCARRGVNVDAVLDRNLPLVHVDGVQVQQVLVNLVRNAAEAMDQAGGGGVVVAARRMDGAVELEVRDSGPGLAEEMMDRLFQPFSTTKATGMGMGLSICRTIVESHGGKLWLVEGGPRGCVFRFTLPTVPPSGEEEGE
jgi:signal transduction histidine kinase